MNQRVVSERLSAPLPNPNPSPTPMNSHPPFRAPPHSPAPPPGSPRRMKRLKKSGVAPCDERSPLPLFSRTSDACASPNARFTATRLSSALRVCVGGAGGQLVLWLVVSKLADWLVCACVGVGGCRKVQRPACGSASCFGWSVGSVSAGQSIWL